MNSLNENASNCHRTGGKKNPEKVYPPSGSDLTSPLENETGVPFPGIAPIPGAPFPLELDATEPFAESSRPRQDDPSKN